MHDLKITDRPGFTPQIGRLVSMMEYVRETTLEVVQGLSMEELDLIPEGHGNSAGMLLEHFVVTEKYYQVFTFSGQHDHARIMEALGERWTPGFYLGDSAREQIKGNPIGHYLNNLAETRAETLRQLAQRDDQWLEEELPLWRDQPANYHFAWFHVFEDELQHRGQLRLLTRFMPRLGNRGRLGALLQEASDGLGLRCGAIWKGTSASDAGLQVGDLILEYNGQDVTQTPFYEIPIVQEAGTISRFKVQRNDEVLKFEIEHRARPS